MSDTVIEFAPQTSPVDTTAEAWHRTGGVTVAYRTPESMRPGPLSRTSERIPVCRPMLPTRQRLAPYLAAIDETRHYSNHGGLALKLQERLAGRTQNRAHVVVAASGTAALAGAILAAAGRASATRPLCLLPAYTFIGTISAVQQCGFVPHFVDIDPQTWVIDIDRCRDHAELERVGLIVPVAPYGRPVPQAAWAAFAADTGIPVVIDGAAAVEGLFAHPDLHVGPVPVAVSFHATKTFCTGEGGGIFCGDPQLWHTAVSCLNFGYTLDRASVHPSINGKMSEYHAAVGLAELAGWDDKRRGFAEVARRYRELGATLQGRLHLAPTIASNYALIETASLADTRAKMHALGAAGIGCRAWYGSGAHRQPYCQRFGRDRLPHAESLADRLLGLPMAADMPHEEVRDVVAALAACDKI